ncbi:hypothetical protein ADM96_08245 [Burkholderia sp. ST111]|nr:hypothetical protein ADM96_08245 [Burkholderia sp. ST111]
MKIKTALVACLVSIGACISAPATADDTSLGVKAFLTGNDFLKLDSAQQLFTVEAMLDGIDFAAYISANDHLVKGLNGCIEGMTGGQATAIVKKYINDNPAKWDWQMSNLTFNAMKGACKQRGYHL